LGSGGERLVAISFPRRETHALQAREQEESTAKKQWTSFVGPRLSDQARRKIYIPVCLPYLKKLYSIDTCREVGNKVRNPIVEMSWCEKAEETVEEVDIQVVAVGIKADNSVSWW
jgi:hypothetical protein